MLPHLNSGRNICKRCEVKAKQNGNNYFPEKESPIQLYIDEGSI